MSASFKTRDGAFSAAAALMAHERSGSDFVPVELPAAIAWAKENNVPLGNSGQALAAINSHRTKFGLPRFRVLQSKHQVRAAPPLSPALSTPVVQPASRAKALAASEDELLQIVATHSGTVTGLVTSEIAKWLLSLNTGNRPMEKGNADRFRTILREGRWQNTGEPIIVSHEGILNDGQHRLAAIVDTGIAAEMDVRFGIPRGAFNATGTAKRRSNSNVLSIEGYPNASCQAAIARLLRHYDARQMAQYRAQVEPAEVLRIVEAEDLIGEVAAKIQRFRFGPARTGPFGFVLVVAARSNPIEKVFAFADVVGTGLGQGEVDPAYRLHVKMRDAAMRRERWQQIDVAILTTKAWNARLHGNHHTPLRIVEADRTSAGFPKIAGGSDVLPAPTA